METPKSSVIQAIEAAVTASPSDILLRLHLAELQSTDGMPQEAFDNARQVLAAAPDNVPALQIAAQAGALIGDPAAAGYQRMHAALTGSTPITNAEPQLPVAPPADEPRPSSLPDLTATPPAPASAASTSIVPPGPTETSGQGQAPPPPQGPPAFPASDNVPQGQNNLTPKSADELIEFWEDEAAPVSNITDVEVPSIRLENVAGMHEVKQRLELSFLGPMRNPEVRAAFGQSLGGGLLLWGPPGCGKTFIAKAIAGELDANFLAIGLSDVLQMHIGNSERNLTEIFNQARENTPCVLFFDEVDSLGQKRTQVSGSAMRGVVNQFLTELDGAGKQNEGVFILAASNHPWDIDSALLRPGRLDRMMLVLPPDAEARMGVLQYNLQGTPQDNLDIAAIAQRSEGFSGADITMLCSNAVEKAMSDSIRTGKVRPVTNKDFKQSLKEVSPSTGPWFETAGNYAQFSNDGGQFDDLLEYLNRK